MKQLALVAVAFSALIFTFCSGSKKATGGPSELIQIETWPCRGFCPTYKMTFLDDGKGEWDGTRSVRKIGKEPFQLTKLETSDLVSRVKKAELGAMPNEFKSGIADAAGFRIVFWENGKKRSISAEGGAKLPLKLIGIETFLRDLGEAHGYDTRKGYNPNEPDPATSASVIVQLKPEVNAGNWLLQWKELKLSLEKRIRPDQNLWVVRFDPAQISPNDLIAAFKTSPDVVLAQPNREVKDRN